jgi:hypothetical protein
MRLKFGAKEWAHALMGLRFAHEAFARGKHYNPGWDRQTGKFLLDELGRLVRHSPDAPQVGHRIPFEALRDLLPEQEGAPLVASAGPPELKAAPQPPDHLTKRLSALEGHVITLMQKVEELGAQKSQEAPLAQGVASAVELAAVKERLGERLAKVFDFIARVEDRLLALERKRK